MLTPQHPEREIERASGLPLGARVACGLGGCAVVLIGFALFGLGFDVIDATRLWRMPSAVVIPAIFVAACIVTAVVGAGLALIAVATTSHKGASE